MRNIAAPDTDSTSGILPDDGPTGRTKRAPKKGTSQAANRITTGVELRRLFSGRCRGGGKPSGTPGINKAAVGPIEPRRSGKTPPHNNLSRGCESQGDARRYTTT